MCNCETNSPTIKVARVMILAPMVVEVVEDVDYVNERLEVIEDAHCVDVDDVDCSCIFDMDLRCYLS